MIRRWAKTGSAAIDTMTPMSTPPRVLVTRRLPGEALSRLENIADVDIHDGDLPLDRDELKARVAGCHGILSLLSDRIDASVMDAAGKNLRVVSNYAVGVNNIDLAAAQSRGVAVGNTPDVLTDATADTAVLLLLAAGRRAVEAVDRVRDGTWKTWEPSKYLGVEPAGRTLGIVGMGRIGLATARRMVGGWGMKLLYTSRQSKPEADAIGGRQVSLNELLAGSDFVSLHVPLTDQTRGMIGRDQFAAMRPTAVLINTARGEVIDQPALAEALRNREIFAAGLDVTTPEPLPPGDPLLASPGITILPHIGSATFTARHAMADIAVDNLIAGLNGRPLRCDAART